MGVWDRALDAAGVDDPALRADFGRQRALVARFRRSAYLAARLLLPRPLLPHVVSTTGFMHHADNLLDSGPVTGRAAAWAEWEKSVRDGLAGAPGADPVIRPLMFTVTARPALRGAVESYLGTARTDLEFTGFETEADYQSYLDGYSLPAFMLVAELLRPPAGSPGYRQACRTFIDASQRLDFVNDLAEDLAGGRLTIPLATMERFGVTRAALETGRGTAAVRDLLDHLLGRARESLAAARVLTGLVVPEGRPMVRALLELEELTAGAAEARGTGLLRGPARPPAPATARLLLREWRLARRGR